MAGVEQEISFTEFNPSEKPPLIFPEEVPGIIARNEPTWDTVLSRARSQLYGIAYRITGLPEDAEDALQNATRRIWERVGQIESTSNISAYFKVAVTREAISMLRGRTRRKSREESLELGEDMRSDTSSSLLDRIPDSGMSVEEQIIKDDEDTAFRRNISELPAVLLLRAEGYSYKEIAQILNIPVDTVKSKLARGKAAIRERYSAERITKEDEENTWSERGCLSELVVFNG